ncbi:ANTAR domain-containing protein [Jatrophihabitans sp.]|jgi:hypothetical protein|uniref:ANTAR domain-containing protein n=1 Tax=Jatrophihabitans sp. TaxID=1932789 RepID=UPI002EF0900B
MSADDRWARLVAIEGEPAPADRQALLQDVLALGLDEVAPGVLGCSITEAGSAGGRSTAVSNALAASLDQAQLDAGDGPCLRAARAQQQQQLDVIAGDDSFASFAAAAGRHGVRSSLSLPVPGTATPTSLNMYAGQPDAFTAERSQAIAGLLARCTATLLGAPREAAPLNVSTAALEDALARRNIVLEAKRRLAARADLTEPEAFRRLARWSQIECCSILEVAHKVLDGQAPPEERDQATPDGQAAPEEREQAASEQRQAAPEQRDQEER